MNNSTRADEWDTTDFLSTYTATIIVASVYSLILLLIIVFNIQALWSLYKAKTEHSTSFSVYLAHLFVMNVLASVTVVPLDVVDTLLSDNLTISQCAFATFANWALFAVVVNSHLLITINRLWAVLWPHNYREVHSIRFAGLSCLILWLYVFVWILPVFTHRISHTDDYRCRLDLMDFPLNQQTSVSVWEGATFVVTFFVPVAVVIAVYPIIEYKRRRAMFLRVRPAPKVDSQQHSGGSSRRRAGHNPDPRTFRILMTLTCSLLFSWMPQLCWDLVQYQVQYQMDPSVYALVDLILNLFWTAQAVIDPILFIFVFRVRAL
ncbi:chemerin-like receptor 1 [Paramacrobiotus metropolitanus]|uniref:chemerin-like receptor 1 n=1 Tax=Paramacrobiotus metropolitanus TaxID=2943436 RepID=UPI002445F4DC|nr:chemerin-like receptor 1 [Paramacrobiotus metropolitanus]